MDTGTTLLLVVGVIAVVALAVLLVRSRWGQPTGRTSDRTPIDTTDRRTDVPGTAGPIPPGHAPSATPGTAPPSPVETLGTPIPRPDEPAPATDGIPPGRAD